MSQALKTAAAGLLAQQRNIDTIAANIANVSTSGYKRSRLEFADAIHAAMQNPAQPVDGQSGNRQLGHGAYGVGISRDTSGGPLIETSRSLDLALAGTGYFTLAADDGSVGYARDGQFADHAAAGRHWLVNRDGRFVLDRNGERISADSPLDALAVDEAGRLSLYGTLLAELGVVDFSNPSSLQAEPDGLFRATPDSGAPQAVAGSVRQGFTEGSNVDLAEEMTRLMQAQRAYALMGRAIATADQMRAAENDIRR